MWLMTPRGFFSAVQDPEFEDQVMVRARVHEDLVNLKAMCPEAGPILAWDLRDYGFRLFMAKDDWAQAVARMALEIDYGNFKDEVRRRQGRERETIYHRVWYELLQLEYMTPKKRGKASKGKKAVL